MPHRNKVKYFLVLCLITYSAISFGFNYDVSNILMAKSTGVWSKGKDYGYFKVIAYRDGLEHPADKVRVLITRANGESNNQAIRKDIQIKSPGIKGYVQDLSLAVVNNQLSLGVDIEMKAMDGIVLRESFLISVDGEVKVVAPVKYIDIYQ